MRMKKSIAKKLQMQNSTPLLSKTQNLFRIFIELFFRLNTILPGSCLLQVQVMDYHALSSDSVIGETTIDLENRWFSKKWRKLKDKPIETRDIYSPICSIATGRVRLFVEIISASDKVALKNVLSIAPKTPEV